MDEDIKLMDKTVFELTVKDGVKLYVGFGIATILVKSAATLALPHMIKLQEKLVEKRQELDKLNLKAVQ